MARTGSVNVQQSAVSIHSLVGQRCHPGRGLQSERRDMLFGRQLSALSRQPSAKSCWPT